MLFSTSSFILTVQRKLFTLDDSDPPPLVLPMREKHTVAQANLLSRVVQEVLSGPVLFYVRGKRLFITVKAEITARRWLLCS